jgi:HK97 family phage major capsid protein
VDFLDLLRQRLESLLAEERGLNDQAESIFTAAAAEQRADLTDAEDELLGALKARRAQLAGDVADTRSRIESIEADRASAAAAADTVKRFNVSIPKPADGGVRGSDHTLDELLWASVDEVPAGSFGQTVDSFAGHHGARNRVERVEVRNGEGRNVPAPRIDEFDPNRRAAIRQFQRTVAEMQLFGLAVSRSAGSGADGFQVAREHPAFRDTWKRVLRAMDTDTSNEGVDWIPTGIGASLHEKVRAAGRVAPLFQRVTLPTNPWKWPLEGADATAYRVAEPTSSTATKVTASTPGTGAATFDAEIMGGRILFSRSLEADSALAILPYVQRKLVQAFVDAEEKAILDGDTDGTHQDSDVGASTTDARTAWDGLRKRALANASSSGAAAASVSILAGIRAAMGRYGVNPADLAFIVGLSSYFDLISDTNVLTVDKLGPNATILNGQLASVYGIPIIVSEHVREDLNASGVYDGITTTKTYALVVNRNEWIMGGRTPLSLETDDSIYRETYQRVVVGFLREDFQNVNAAGSSADDTAISYNITP